MPLEWKVILWVLTSEGNMSRPVVGAGVGAAFSCWDCGPMGQEGVWLGSPGQAKNRKNPGAGLWDRRWASFVIFYRFCVTALNLEQQKKFSDIVKYQTNSHLWFFFNLNNTEEFWIFRQVSNTNRFPNRNMQTSPVSAYLELKNQTVLKD